MRYIYTYEVVYKLLPPLSALYPFKLNNFLARLHICVVAHEIPFRVQVRAVYNYI